MALLEKRGLPAQRPGRHLRRRPDRGLRPRRHPHRPRRRALTGRHRRRGRGRTAGPDLDRQRSARFRAVRRAVVESTASMRYISRRRPPTPCRVQGRRRRAGEGVSGQIFIDGRWREGAGEASHPSIPPPATTVWEGAAAADAEVAEAVAAARARLPRLGRPPAPGAHRRRCKRYQAVLKAARAETRRGHQPRDRQGRCGRPRPSWAPWRARSTSRSAPTTSAPASATADDRLRPRRPAPPAARRGGGAGAVQLPRPPAQRPHRPGPAGRRHGRVQAVGGDAADRAS